MFILLSVSSFPCLILQSQTSLYTVACDLLCFLLDCIVHTVLFLVNGLLLICPLRFGCLFLVVVNWWFPLLDLSSLVEVPRCLSYFRILF